MDTCIFKTILALLFFVTLSLCQEFKYSVKVCPNTNYEVVEEQEFKSIKFYKNKVNNKLDHQIIFTKKNLDYRSLIEGGSVVVNIKSFYPANELIGYFTVCGKTVEIVDLFLQTKRIARMGFTNFGGKFCKRVEIEQAKEFVKTIFSEVKDSSTKEISDILGPNSNTLISEFSYSVLNNQTNMLELGFKIKNDYNSNLFTFKIPKEYQLLYCNGMTYNSMINIEKNLYVPKVVNYTRSVVFPGFHKSYQNELVIEKFINQNCTIKANEFISTWIFFDLDEFKRLHDLNAYFDYPIDIERPANKSAHHFSHYFIPFKEFNGTTLVANITSEGNWEFKWLIPFHLRYILPDKKTPNADVNKEFTTILVRMPELFYTCTEDVIPKQKEITDFEELIANELDISKNRWTRLHYHDNSEDKHHQVEVPIVPLRGKFMLFEYIPIYFEYFSACIVLSSMILIGLTSVIKTES